MHNIYPLSLGNKILNVYDDYQFVFFIIIIFLIKTH